MRSVDGRASTPSEAGPDEQLVPEPAADPAPPESPPEPVGETSEITTSDT
jgi:hypothetical protein